MRKTIKGKKAARARNVKKGYYPFYYGEKEGVSRGVGGWGGGDDSVIKGGK